MPAALPFQPLKFVSGPQNEANEEPEIRNVRSDLYQQSKKRGNSSRKIPARQVEPLPWKLPTRQGGKCQPLQGAPARSIYDGIPPATRDVLPETPGELNCGRTLAPASLRALINLVLRPLRCVHTIRLKKPVP